MELKIFINELEKALIKRGVAEAAAKKHVAHLCKSFTADDLSEISEINDSKVIEGLADSISVIIHNGENEKENAEKQFKEERSAQADKGSGSPIHVQTKNDDSTSGNIPLAPRNKPVQRPTSPARPAERKIIDFTDEQDDIDDDLSSSAFADYDLERGEKGVTIFWVAFALTLPLTAAILASVAALFALTFIGLTAIILLGFVGVVVISALGTFASLAGVIYGVTQLFSNVPVGIYEIGLGIVVVGITLFSAVALYNVAVRLIPWIISKVKIFMMFTFRKLTELFFYLRKECYKL